MNPSRRFANWLSAQRFIPYRQRMSAIRRIAPGMLKDHAFEADLLGLRFAGNTANFIDRMIYLTGAHEKHMLFFLRDFSAKLKHEKPGRIAFYDVGANAGNHSLALSQWADEVIAFEPWERVRSQFEANIARNRIRNIRVFPFGLGDENKKLPFYAGPDSNLGAASFVPGHTDYNTYLQELEVRSGDDVMRQENLPPITLLKADVEGFEKQVLEGLKDTLRRDRPLLIVEMSETTLASFGGDAQAIRAAFPADYAFYYFSQGSYNSGRYRLAPYDFSFHYKHQDMIACPKEWEKWLR